MSEFKIYALLDPATKEIRYVGITKNKLRSRLNGHLRLTERGGQWHVNRWIRKLQNEPIIELLEIVDESSWREAEIKWIKFYRDSGAKLTNMTDGGEGILGYKYSEEQVERMKARLRGKPLAEETKRKIGLSNSISMLGKKPSEETLRKKSESAKKYFEKNSSHRKGAKHTEEAKMKISKTFKGKPWKKSRRDAQEKRKQNVA